MSSTTTITKRKKAPKMTVILRGVPKGFDWGWYSREDPRMHLQIVDSRNPGRYKVWLERDGNRVFEPVGKIAGKILKVLEAEVKNLRRYVESRWTNLMIENDWLAIRMRGREVTVIAYPAFPGARFTRTFDIADYFPARYNPDSLITDKTPIKFDDLGLNKDMAAIEVFKQKDESLRHHIFLPTILWKD
ncbi:MAG: hypothetical protein HYR84_13740 [Planctomycetes bacterium]|nr:hypothetical protein [Planctomycetota bacterium]